MQLCGYSWRSYYYPLSITAVFRYQVTGNKFEDVGTINVENRTVEFKKSLSLVLPKLKM
jgi:hypothetical protein